MNIDFMFRNLFCKLIAFIFMDMGWLCFKYILILETKRCTFHVEFYTASLFSVYFNCDHIRNFC